MAHTIRIKIGGIPYSVTSDEEEAYVRQLAGELEHKMNTLARQNPFLSTPMVAVLTALDAADAAKKEKQHSEELRLEIKRLTEELTCARLDAEMANRKLAERAEQAAKSEENND